MRKKQSVKTVKKNYSFKKKEKSLQNQTLIKNSSWAVWFEFCTHTVRGAANACRRRDRTREQRTCCLVFDTHLKAPMFSLCTRACGGLQLPACFWGALIASSLPPGKTPSPSLPPPLSFSPLPPPSPRSPHQLPLFAQTTLTPSILLFRFSLPTIPSGQQVWVEVYCGDQSW